MIALWEMVNSNDILFDSRYDIGHDPMHDRKSTLNETN